MSKVNPPELKRLMDKKMTSEWMRGERGREGWRARAAHATGAGEKQKPCRRSPLISLSSPSHESSLPTVTLNGNRVVTGVLRGFDQVRGKAVKMLNRARTPSRLLNPPPHPILSHHPTKQTQFMNLVLDGAVDEKARSDMGMVVIRGASVVTIEALEFVPAGEGGG